MENYIYLHNSFISNPYNGGVTYIDSSKNINLYISKASEDVKYFDIYKLSFTI